MRCLSIAEYFRSKKMMVIFLTKSDQIEKQITNKGFKIKKIPKTSSIEEELSYIKLLMFDNNIKIILLDINNYVTFRHFDEYRIYLDKLKKLSLFLISFEDFKDYPYASDIVIIPYFGAEGIKLHNKPTCKYLLGPKYCILRDEFLKIKHVAIRKKVESILITMGGSDPKGITMKVLKALNSTDIEVKLNVIIGKFSQISKNNVKKVLGNYKGNYSIAKDVNNIAQLMSESDIAIINSGLTKYEISAVGLPGIVISNNEKHCKQMDEFAKYGSVIHLGEVNAVQRHQITDAVRNIINNFNKRKQMSDVGKLLIDGKAMDRILSEIPKEFINA